MAIQAFPHFIGVRLSTTEKTLLDRMAARENTSLSGMVRECIVRESVRPLFEKRPRDDDSEPQ